MTDYQTELRRAQRSELVNRCMDLIAVSVVVFALGALTLWQLARMMP